MIPITAVIVDDEPLARENLRDLLQAEPRIEVVGEAGTVEQAREMIAATRPAAIFLDIQLPGGSGFDLLPLLEQPLQVIFVTAYDQYALRAFRVNALDYLLKPIAPALLAAAVRRLRPHGASPSPEVRQSGGPAELRLDDEVWLDTCVRCFLVPVIDIAAIQAMANYTTVLLADARRYTVRQTLVEWGRRLPQPAFVQLDRSLIVNRHQIRFWQPDGRNTLLRLGTGNVPLKVGRAASQRIRKLLKPSS